MRVTTVDVDCLGLVLNLWMSCSSPLFWAPSDWMLLRWLPACLPVPPVRRFHPPPCFAALRVRCPCLGVHPMVASATSAVMILYTSFTATTSFMVFGLLEVRILRSRILVDPPPPLPTSSPSWLYRSCCRSFALVFFLKRKEVSTKRGRERSSRLQIISWCFDVCKGHQGRVRSAAAACVPTVRAVFAA